MKGPPSTGAAGCKGWPGGAGVIRLNYQPLSRHVAEEQIVEALVRSRQDKQGLRRSHRQRDTASRLVEERFVAENCAELLGALIASDDSRQRAKTCPVSAGQYHRPAIRPARVCPQVKPNERILGMINCHPYIRCLITAFFSSLRFETQAEKH